MQSWNLCLYVPPGKKWTSHVDMCKKVSYIGRERKNSVSLFLYPHLSAFQMIQFGKKSGKCFSFLSYLWFIVNTHKKPRYKYWEN